MLLASAAPAQSLPWAEAKQYILLAAPNLTDEALAQGLWQAMVRRGARVYILLDPKEANAPYAYTMSLHFAGAQIRLARVNQMEAIVDGTRYLGPNLGPKNLRDFHTRFLAAWQKAPAYQPSLNPEGVKVVPHDPLLQLSRFVEETLRQDLERYTLARRFRNPVKP